MPSEVRLASLDRIILEVARKSEGEEYGCSWYRQMAAMGFAAVLALWLVAGCGGGGGNQEEQQEQRAPVVGEFVGEVPDTDAFLALIAEAPQEEGEDSRNIRAYLCDGRQLSEWFTGTANGDQVDLATANGVQLGASLSR